MTAFNPLVPSKAIEILEVAGIPHAHRLLRDHAAAGLVRSYATIAKSIDVCGTTSCVRGGSISTDLWRRIIREGVDDEVWTGGTVRLVADDLIGGAPGVEITGIEFNEADIQRLVSRHRGMVSKHPRAKASAPAPTPPQEQNPPPPPPTPLRKAVDLSALHAGALSLTVRETEAALSIGRTTLYKLLNAGDLERGPSKAGTRITAASVRRYAGLTEVKHD